MKKLTPITFLILAMTFTALAQGSKDEQEILKINDDFSSAYMKRDIAWFERVLSDDYTYSGPEGKAKNKTQVLDELRAEAAKPTYKSIEEKSVDPKIHVMGDAAILTAGWTSLTSGLGNGAEPHRDNGRYTSIYEKRNGTWLIIAEHVSEAPHDRKAMEQQVAAAGLAYNEMLKRGDAAAIERIYADNYMYTTSDGTTSTRDQEIARHKSGKIKFEIAESTDQKVRVIGNGTAVETATFRVKGTNDGKPFDVTERYTTTWLWKDGRWQIVADHTSTTKN